MIFRQSGGFSHRRSSATVRGVTRAALLIALALALVPAASAAAARPHVLTEHDLPGMKASFTATHPLTTIKRFVAVYSHDHSRKRDRQELRQCGFKAGTATALFQAGESADATKPVAVWTSVVKCRTAAQALRFAESFQIADAGRQPSDAEIRQLFPMLPPA